jgi:uncharacterized delta-60 repeat protein
VRPGNALLVSGTSIFVAGGGSNTSAVLAQYNASGTLSHLTTTNIGGNASWNAIALSGSNVLVAGSGTNSNSQEIALGEYNSSDSLVTSFGSSGITLTGVGGAWFNGAGGGYAAAEAMTVLSSGKILLSGYGQYYTSPGVRVQGYVLAQYTTSGTLDPTFGTDGVVIPPTTGMFSGAAAMTR